MRVTVWHVHLGSWGDGLNVNLETRAPPSLALDARGTGLAEVLASRLPVLQSASGQWWCCRARDPEESSLGVGVGGDALEDVFQESSLSATTCSVGRPGGHSAAMMTMRCGVTYRTRSGSAWRKRACGLPLTLGAHRLTKARRGRHVYRDQLVENKRKSGLPAKRGGHALALVAGNLLSGRSGELVGSRNSRSSSVGIGLACIAATRSIANLPSRRAWRGQSGHGAHEERRTAAGSYQQTLMRTVGVARPKGRQERAARAVDAGAPRSRRAWGEVHAAQHVDVAEKTGGYSSPGGAGVMFVFITSLRSY